ncbi:HTH domain-containing protein [Candidatus Woesearchaeota archaeon]|nr:HTH domain-containing protein [Candidatus Woesearchaeota archaeon]
MIIRKRITILQIRKPLRTTLNEELQWFGNSLGLFNLRDKDKSCFRVFIELLKAAKAGIPISSDKLAANLGLTRATVIHHINTLREKGIVIAESRGYLLRQPNLKLLVEDLKRDMDRTYDEIGKVAEQIDGFLGL